MVHYSVWLFLLVLIGALLMTKIIKGIGKKSSEYFVRNHKATADMEGFIEEMINGQKVVKVFCHEEEAKKDFDKFYEELCFAATSANKTGNTLMQIMHNIGNMIYVVVAIVGCMFLIYKVPNLGVLFYNEEQKLVFVGLNKITIGIIIAKICLAFNATNKKFFLTCG
jgi:ATP-binding cassette subfamily B protein